MKEKKSELINLGGHVLSDKVSASLLESLRTGIYADSDRLPPEVELAESLKVSRTVIRDALSELERSGYIERVRGIGTIVNRDVVSAPYRLDQKLEYFDLVRSTGRTPASEGVRVARTAASAEIAQKLHLPEGEELLKVTKCVTADGKPVIYSVDYIPCSFFSGCNLNAIDFSKSIFTILTESCGQPAASNLANIKAISGDETICSALALPLGSALLLLEETCFNRLCKPIMCSFSYYTDCFDYTVLRKLI